MKPKPIGIVGGAGPLAGASLLQRVLYLASREYGCCKDGDFPKVFLLSFPFSEMLLPNANEQLVKNELDECLNQLRTNGAGVIAIACNTLHAFLDQQENLSDIVHLPKEMANQIPRSDLPLVLCTSTSVKFSLHRKYFPCEYPDVETQAQVDDLITRILNDAMHPSIFDDLCTLLKCQSARTIVLGCTELSLFSDRLSIINKSIIDPVEIAARKLLEKSFLNL